MTKYLHIQIDENLYLYNQRVSWDLKYQADIVKDNFLKSNKFGRHISDHEIFIILIANNIVPPNYDEIIKKYVEDIDNFKVSLYEERFFDTKKKSIRKEIDKLKNEYKELIYKRHSLDYITLEFLAEDARQDFLIHQSLDKEVSDDIFLKIKSYLIKNQISNEEIRNIAKNDNWRSYWSNIKRHGIGDEISDYQAQLMNFSKMYDRIYESVDCPDESVIQDNDMLDGWMIQNHRKREKEKNKDELNNKIKRHAGADEIYITARSPEERKKIESLNDATSQLIKKQRMKMLQQKGTVKDSEFLDRRYNKK